MGMDSSFVTCVANDRQLITQNFVANSDATGGASTQNFTVPTGRGRVKRIQLVATSQTLADLNSRFVTVLINGVQVIVNEPFTKFSSFFPFITREYRTDWSEKATITVNISQGSAVAQAINIILFFVD